MLYRSTVPRSSLALFAVTAALAACGSTPSGGGGGGGAATTTTTAPAGRPLGAACLDNLECSADGSALCLPNGVCGTETCTTGACGEGADCFLLSATARTCLPTCSEATACPGDLVCTESGACLARCTAESCVEGSSCNAETGLCDADLTKLPSAAPIPACDLLPERDCTLGNTACSALSAFDPKLGDGYEDYPLNGETTANQYRSYSRQDMQLLVKHVAAFVECRAKHWAFGTHKPLALGDMSEQDGAIPGTSKGSPGHPEGTHEQGLDMDLGYFQVDSPDNRLRPICPHMTGTTEAYHCTGAPDKLDVWRTTLALGVYFTSTRVRVIGCDGQVGPLVEAAAPALCAAGYMPAVSCTRIRSKLAYEVTNEGAGWYLFHHHHFHVSLTNTAYKSAQPLTPAADEGVALWPASKARSPLAGLERFAGHARVAP